MSDSIPPPDSSATPDSNPPKKKKRRLWKKLLIGLLVIVILIGVLIALAPMIISTDAVKSIALGQVNKQLNGRVDIASWSIGWTSGLRADGIRVYDASNAQIAQVKSAGTQLSLIGAARGNLDFGQTVLDSLDADMDIDKNGKSNFEKLVKSSDSPAAKPAAPPSDNSAPAKPAGKPTKLPKLKGDFKLLNAKIKVHQEGQPETLFVTADGGAVIADLNQPIDHKLVVTMQIGQNGKPGKLTVAGKAVAVKNDEVDLNTANADEAVTIESIDLPGLAPFIPASAGVIPRSGVINGQLALNLKDGKSAVASGTINGKNIKIGGDALKGDEFVTQLFQIAIAPITINMPNGPTDVNAITIAAEKPLAVTFDQGGVTADVNVPLSAVINLAANKAPGAAGNLNLDANVDVGKLAAMLPHLFQIPKGTQINSGQFSQTLVVAITPDVATVTAKTGLTGVAGTKDSKPVKLTDITVDLAAKVRGSNTALPDLRDLVLDLKTGSNFASAHFEAPTITSLKGSAQADLQKLQAEVSQVFDFNGSQLAGNFALAVDTTGDPTDLTKPAVLNATATLTGLSLTAQRQVPPADPASKAAPTTETYTVTQKWIEAKITNAQLQPTKEGSLQSLSKAVVTVKTDDAANPTINLEIADISATFGDTMTASWTSKLTADLQKLMQEIKPAVPALSTAPQLDLGLVSANTAGTVSQTKDSMAVEIKTLTASESKGLFNISQANPITLKIAGKQMQPSGKLQIAADLVRLSKIVKDFSHGKSAVLVNGKEQTLNSGKLAGTVELASLTANTMSVAVDMTASELSVDTASGPTAQQTVTFGLKTTPAADFTSITNTSVYLKSTFADVNVKNVSLQLPPGGMPTLNNPADVNIDVQDVGPLNTLAQAFIPTPIGPDAAPAIQVTRGAMKIIAHASQTGQTITLTVDEISTSDQLRLQRGSPIYKVKPIKLNLVAAAAFSKDMTEISKITISQLSGTLGVADISMPQPIIVDNPTGAMTASGAINVGGKIEDVTQMLEFLHGKDPGTEFPYSGVFALNENISTNGTTVVVKGPITVDNFKQTSNGQVVLNEPKISIVNDLGIDLTNHNAKINALSVDMPASGAVKLNVTGGVTDWVTKRQIDNIVVKLSYDLEKLWPMVMPLLSPEQQAQFKDLALTGKFDKTINVSGTLPADVDFAKAIKLLTASGDVEVATAKWPSNGVDASNIVVPFTLKDGLLRPVYAGKLEGQNQATPMIVNTGKVFIGGLVVDLTQPDPRLSIPPNYVLADKISLNSVLGSQIGKLSPLFFGADQATGLVSVTITECNKFPLSKLATHTGPANDGDIKLVYNVDQLKIDGGMATLIGAIADTGNSLRGDVRNATISIANGEVKQDTTLTIGERGNLGLRLYGGVNLESLKLDNFFVNFPSSMLGKVDRNLMKYLPAGVDVAMKGTIGGKMSLDPGNSIKNMVADAVKKAALGSILGRNDKPDNTAGPTSQPAQPKPDDTIKDLTDLFGKKKKKK